MLGSSRSCCSRSPPWTTWAMLGSGRVWIRASSRSLRPAFELGDQAPGSRAPRPGARASIAGDEDEAEDDRDDHHHHQQLDQREARAGSPIAVGRSAGSHGDRPCHRHRIVSDSAAIIQPSIGPGSDIPSWSVSGRSDDHPRDQVGPSRAGRTVLQSRSATRPDQRMPPRTTDVTAASPT